MHLRRGSANLAGLRVQLQSGRQGGARGEIPVLQRLVENVVAARGLEVIGGGVGCGITQTQPGSQLAFPTTERTPSSIVGHSRRHKPPNRCLNTTAPTGAAATIVGADLIIVMPRLRLCGSCSHQWAGLVVRR